MKRAFAVLLLVAGGCFAAGALSSTTYTTLTCESCRLPFVATGQEIKVELDWPCSDDQESDGSCTDLVRATAECAGVTCTSEYDPSSGLGFVRVRATSAGTLSLRVSYTDGLKRRTEDFGPIRVVAPDRVDLACWARAPAETEYRRCDDGVRAGGDVRVDVVARSGDLRLAGVAPDVEIDGAVVPLGVRNADSIWTCHTSLATPDGGGGATTCIAYALSPGAHSVRVRLGQLASELTLQVDTEAP